MDPILSDGKPATTQNGLCLYAVKREEACDGVESARSWCFAGNTEAKTFSDLSVL